ncbi:hypothetical protein ROSI111154_14330 [Rouxiella silvae]
MRHGAINRPAPWRADEHNRHLFSVFEQVIVT